MTHFGKSWGLVGLMLVAGCNVTVNNESLDNQIDAAASDFGNITDAADRAAEGVANTIETQAEALENGVDVNVDLRDRDRELQTNKQ